MTKFPRTPALRGQATGDASSPSLGATPPPFRIRQRAGPWMRSSRAARSWRARHGIAARLAGLSAGWVCESPGHEASVAIVGLAIDHRLSVEIGDAAAGRE